MINKKKIQWLYQLSRHCSAPIILNLIFNKQKKSSVLFFTQNKSASTFITKVMTNIEKLKQGYKHVNYSNIVDDLGCSFNFGKRFSSEYNWYSQNSRILFKNTKYIYGPFRAAFFIPGTDLYKKIIFLRDPRDSLISRYYSFGFSHGTPKDNVSAIDFLAEREFIQTSSIDDYCIRMAHEWSKPLLYNYKTMMSRSIEKVLSLQYEEYAKNPHSVIKKIFDYCELKNADEMIHQLVLKAEPISKSVDINLHKRSGRTGQFHTELKTDTIQKLNKILLEELNWFGWNV